MNRVVTKCYLLVVVGGLLLCPAYGLDYQSGFSFIQVPDPLSGNNPTYPLIARNVPTLGESFYDPRFQTVLTRVTQVDGISGRHEYSRFDPFNCDQSLVILLFASNADWKIYRTQTFPYNQSANLVMTLPGVNEPRWDPADPQLLWYLQDFRIVTVNVSTGQETIVKDFSSDPIIGLIISAETDLYRITTKDEGESSSDKRYWALFLQGAQDDYRVRYVFTWDRQTDQVLGVYQIPLQEASIDWVGMSTMGNWVLIGGDYDNGGNLAGLTMANKQLSQFHRLDYATAHSDVGLDSEGNEVIVMQNVVTDHIDLIPIALTTQPILQQGGSYANTNRTPLVRLFYDAQSQVNLNSGVHISSNVPGYCVVSTYIQPGFPEQNWLDRTITLVRLDKNDPRVFCLAKVYNTTGTYWEETHAAITNDGSKVVWTSNWDKNVGAEQVFLMQLDMPRDWKVLTGGEQPVYFPHIESDGTWDSEVGIINSSATTVTGTLRPYSDAGTAVSTALSVTLAPHGRRQVRISQEFTNPNSIGYVVFESGSSLVKGYSKLFRAGNDRVALPAVGRINSGTILMPHLASTGGWQTQITLVNTTSSSTTATLEFSTGQTATLTLAAGERRVFTVADLFGGQAQDAIISGLIRNGSGLIGAELFSSGALISGVLLEDKTAQTIYYPHVASSGGWWTGLVAYNPSATACTLTVTPYSAAGVSLSTVTQDIPAGQKYIGTAESLGLPTETAWMQINGTNETTGFELFGSGQQLAGYTGVGIRGKEGVFAKIEKEGWTGIAFVNTESSTATVTLTAYDDSGMVVATATTSVPAHQKVVNYAESLFTESISTATHLAYSSDKEVVGFQLNSADPTMLDALPGL